MVMAHVLKQFEMHLFDERIKGQSLTEVEK